MRIRVVAKPGSKMASVRKVSDGSYEIRVTEPAERGRATDAVRRALAHTLGVARSRISLVMGATSRVKVFTIDE